MSFFSKLFGKKEESQTPTTNNNTAPQASENKDTEKQSISVMLLYNTVPNYSEDSLQKSIAAAFGNDINMEMLVAEGKSLIITGTLNGDKMMVAGLDFAYPQSVLDEILPICHFSAADKEKFSKSEYHVLLSLDYSDTPRHLQFDRLYQLASCLCAEEGGVIGIVNESAMTANPLLSLAKIGEERNELLSEKAMPFWSWLSWTGGFVKYVLDEKTIWYVTKGNHQFNQPELAFKGGVTEGNDTLMLFNALFSYMYGYNAVLKVGHTAEIGGLNLKFTAVKEYANIFEGKFGTLVVNKI
jgi:hypothetical protein